MNDDKCCVEKKETTLNSVFVQLANAVSIAGQDADRYAAKINKLDMLYPESVAGAIKQDAIADDNQDTLLYKLRVLAKRLETINLKNNEILDKLEELI